MWMELEMEMKFEMPLEQLEIEMELLRKRLSIRASRMQLAPQRNKFFLILQIYESNILCISFNLYYFVLF